MMNCPECGTPLLAELSGQAICPTCGASLSPSQLAAEPETVASPRQSNRQVGFLILLVMLFMAAVGLIFALKTIEWRRANDKKDARNNISVIPAQAGIQISETHYLDSRLCGNDEITS
jgi:transcription initiation factor TFIIIB Brf1 subunit/transcription initiation factor TFIIB